MSRDPQLQALLERIKSFGVPDPAVLGAAGMRNAYRAMAKMLDSREVAIGKVENLQVTTPAGPREARLYTPVAAGATALPGLLFFHGGGLVMGDLETHDTLCRGLAAESGCRVLALDYRLAPEHKFPAAFEDALATLKWLEDNAPLIGIDAYRIAVGGDSAGGLLAAALCQAVRGQSTPAIAFQLLLYPLLQFDLTTASRTAQGEGVFREAAFLAWAQALCFGDAPPGADPRGAPFGSQDLSGLPPAYIVTAGLDPLHDEGADYAARLQAAGVPVTHAAYDEMIHGFMSMSAVLDTARTAVGHAAQALKAALAG